MEGSDSQRATTDEITWIAEDPRLRRRKVRNLAAILLILSIAEGHDPLNAILDALRQIFNGTVAYGRSLTVTVSDEECDHRQALTCSLQQ